MFCVLRIGIQRESCFEGDSLLAKVQLKDFNWMETNLQLSEISSLPVRQLVKAVAVFWIVLRGGGSFDMFTTCFRL